MPTKRDFVSYNVPRPFLSSWEKWLQESLADSKLRLGEGWQAVFLGLPIWRFWIGKEPFGQAVTGALMPSVDGVGRYFPLTVCAVEPEGMQLQLPFGGALDQWHGLCENLLLQVLDESFSQDLPTMLQDLPFPPVSAAPKFSHSGAEIMDWTATSPTFAAAFDEIAAHDVARTYAQRSFWWTMGGASHREHLVTIDGEIGNDFIARLMTLQFS